ncbi:MAG: glycoside hydrolase, partial [Muribaculaceae bacterium]|nr:glycoside hydrolase [Muribaculaceae bacterium]
ATYANGTQAALGVALYSGIVPEGKEAAVAESLHKAVEANDYFLDYGLLGSKTVPAMLTRYGYVDDAYRMATKTDAPSWGYWLEKMGYTTLPETWTLSPEFHDASLNHVFMGDICSWMRRDLAGINHDPAKPGFANVIIRPHYPAGLASAEATYKSVRGNISSSWKRDGDNIRLTVTVPGATTATVYAPEPVEVGEGTHTFKFKV